MKANQLIMEIAGEVSDHSGVQLGEKQRDMIVNRLRRRMYSLGLKSEEEYVRHYIENRSEEFKHLLSLFTTHHTFFFREFKQFEVLRDEVIDQILPKIKTRQDKTLRIWSAACSRGHEVYSLAAFLLPLLEEKAPDVRLEICGTDVDEISVEFAGNAVFLKKEVDSIPLVYQTGNFVRGTAGLEDFVKVHPKLREKCWFKHANLMETSSWPDGKFDLVFCRNVFIYFSQADIARVLSGFRDRMQPHGTLFLGLTESLNGISKVFKPIGPSIYLPETATNAVPMTQKESMVRELRNAYVEKASPKVEAKKEEIKRVLCVDDSPTVLDLMKGIFVPAAGYMVAATASDGAQAAEILKTEKFDLITLDIHMPNMTGLEFMQKAYLPQMPPVIVVSSVERTEKNLALEMMKLGAMDYIQKPSLKDFSQYKEEIYLKAKTVIAAKRTAPAKAASVKNSLDIEFAGDELQKMPKGMIGVFFKEEDCEKVRRFLFANKSTGVLFKLVCVMKNENIDLVRTHFADYSTYISEVHRQSVRRNSLHLPSMDVGVVVSHFADEQLNLFGLLDTDVFLAEEAYSVERIKLSARFDLFPVASLGYMVKKTLQSRVKKG